MKRKEHKQHVSVVSISTPKQHSYIQGVNMFIQNDNCNLTDKNA